MRDVGRADQLGQANQCIGNFAGALELAEDLGLELQGGDVVGRSDEDRVDVSEGVLEHLVLDVDAGL